MYIIIHTIDGKSGTDRRKKWDRFVIIDGKSGTDRRKKWDRLTYKNRPQAL